MRNRFSSEHTLLRTDVVGTGGSTCQRRSHLYSSGHFSAYDNIRQLNNVVPPSSLVDTQFCRTTGSRGWFIGRCLSSSLYPRLHVSFPWPLSVCKAVKTDLLTYLAGVNSVRSVALMPFHETTEFPTNW